MKIAAVIPARFQSSRFPGKLLAKAQGKTVLQRTFENTSLCPELDAIVVATDDERIAEHVRSFHGEVLWTSPSCKNGTERIAEAYSFYTPLQKADLILNVQGDHPCISPTTLSATIAALEDSTALVSTAVCPITAEELSSPHIVKCVFDRQNNALYFSRSPIPGYGHIGIYCYRNAFFRTCHLQPSTPLQLAEDLEQLKILEWGYRVKVAPVDEILLGIDTPQDLEKLDQLLCQSISS